MTSSVRRVIRGRSGSDFHIGAAKLSAAKIIDAARRLMTNEKTFSECDLMIFAGDIFDHLLSMPSEPAVLAREWIDDTTILASKYPIVVRWLEGTPLHDWKQTQYVEQSLNKMNLDADVRYIKEVEIEWIERLGIHVLYIPDEAHDTCTITKGVVQELLAEWKLESVDVIVMHGQFRHHYPDYVPDEGMDFHDYDYYSSITRHFMFAGHIHVASVFGKAITHGSIERTGHGYETPKGVVGFELDLDNPKLSKTWFIENSLATTFKTITVSTDDVAIESVRIRQIAESVALGSHLRIVAEEGNPILPLAAEFKKEYPLLHWKSERKGKSTRKTLSALKIKVPRSRVSIRSDNVAELLMPYMEDLNETDRLGILSVLEECKHV